MDLLYQKGMGSLQTGSKRSPSLLICHIWLTFDWEGFRHISEGLNKFQPNVKGTVISEREVFGSLQNERVHPGNKVISSGTV